MPCRFLATIAAGLSIAALSVGVAQAQTHGDRGGWGGASRGGGGFGRGPAAAAQAPAGSGAAAGAAPTGRFGGRGFAARPGGYRNYSYGRRYYPYAGVFGFGFSAALVDPWYWGGYYVDPWFYGPPPYAYYPPGYAYDVPDGDAPPPPAAPQPPQACGHWNWNAQTQQYDWIAGRCT